MVVTKNFSVDETMTHTSIYLLIEFEFKTKLTERVFNNNQKLFIHVIEDVHEWSLRSGCTDEHILRVLEDCVFYLNDNPSILNPALINPEMIMIPKS
jgi:hypothetical protein